MKRGNIKLKWALYTGFLLWIIGLVLRVAFAPVEESFESQLFLSLSSYCKWFLSLLVFVVAIPFFAEGVFRYWATGEKRSMWVSVACMSLAVIVIIVKSSGWVMCVISVLSILFVAITLYFLLRRKDFIANNYLFLIFGSTLVWIAYYVSHVENLYPCLIFEIIKLSGLSLVCCYLVINHGVLCAVLAHAINNAIVAVPLAIYGGQHDNIEVELNGTNFTINRVFTEERVNAVSDEKIVLQGNINNIVLMLAQQNKNHNVLYVPCMNDGFLNYRFQASSESEINPGMAFSAMETMGLITMDTSYEPLWIVELPISLDLESSKAENVEMTTMENFASWIRMQYHIPVILEPSLNPRLSVPLPGNIIERGSATQEDLISQINNAYNVKISKMPYDKACVVKVYRQ